MKVIDFIGWQILRCLFFISFLLWTLAADIIQYFGIELSRKDTIELMGHIYSMAMMYQLPNPDGLPGPVQDKLRPFGRILVAAFAFQPIYDVLKALIKMKVI